ncbi:MAG: hypothetical protein ACFE8U_17610, partial [Candidatus Hermodarchaeota archaeon]
MKIRLGNGKVVLATGIPFFMIEKRPPSKQRTDSRSKSSNKKDISIPINQKKEKNSPSSGKRVQKTSAIDEFLTHSTGKKNVNFRVIPFDPDGAYC